MNDKLEAVIDEMIKEKMKEKPVDPGNLKVYTVNLPDGFMDHLSKDAKKQCISRSSLIRTIIRRYIEESL